MKFLCFLFLAIPVLSLSAQAQGPSKSVNTKTTLPAVTFTGHIDKEAEWLKSTASHIPLKGNEPYYDTAVRYKDEFSRDDMDHNAEYYFRKMFNSKLLKLENNKHSYTGYGVYVFSTDKRNQSPSMYKVYYTLEVSVKGSNYYVEMHDFKLENQHSEVSFINLLKSARDNDARAKQILALFHNNNEYEMKRLNNIMSSKENLSKLTASLR